MAKVIWFSKYPPIPAQIDALKEIYGDDIEVEMVDRRFEAERQFLEFIEAKGANGVYAVMPLEKIQQMMRTKIGKQFDWLWSEYDELDDGVRSENEEGFDPNRDMAGYIYNIGQHRRFLGFSKIKNYVLETEPLNQMVHERHEMKKMTPEERSQRWKTAFADFGNLLYDKETGNRVYVKIIDSKKTPDNVYVVAYYNKDTMMFDELRPELKKMGFKFDTKHSSWFVRVPREFMPEIVGTITKTANQVVENLAVRVLQKNGLWATLHNQEFLINSTVSRRGGIVKINDKTTQKEEKVAPAEPEPPEMSEDEDEIEM